MTNKGRDLSLSDSILCFITTFSTFSLDNSFTFLLIAKYIVKMVVFFPQSTSIADERYDEYRRSSDFIKEYIFPGACVPSLSRITSAMGVASRLWYELLCYAVL